MSAADSSKHVISAGVSALGELESGWVSCVAVTSAVPTMTAAMVSEYAWSGRATASRDSKWKARLRFCEGDGRVPVQVTEGIW